MKQEKENQHECARRTAWLLHRCAVSPGRDFMHRSLPRPCLFRMLLLALQRCQYDCLHSHTEDQIWLHQTKQKPQSMLVVVFFFFIFILPLSPPASTFLSEISSLIRVTEELQGCAGTTANVGWEQGIWIHLVKTRFKPVLPARERFI